MGVGKPRLGMSGSETCRCATETLHPIPTFATLHATLATPHAHHRECSFSRACPPTSHAGVTRCCHLSPHTQSPRGQDTSPNSNPDQIEHQTRRFRTTEQTARLRRDRSSTLGDDKWDQRSHLFHASSAHFWPTFHLSTALLDRAHFNDKMTADVQVTIGGTTSASN